MNELIGCLMCVHGEQWLIGVPNATTFMGCIGRDEFGRILEKKVIEAGVNPRYKYHDSEPTGTCAVCLTGTNRSVLDHCSLCNISVSCQVLRFH